MTRWTRPPRSVESAVWSWALPNDPSLAGRTFHNQGVAFDPGANALGATVTNAGESTIGAR